MVENVLFPFVIIVLTKFLLQVSNPEDLAKVSFISFQTLDYGSLHA